MSHRCARDRHGGKDRHATGEETGGGLGLKRWMDSDGQSVRERSHAEEHRSVKTLDRCDLRFRGQRERRTNGENEKRRRWQRESYRERGREGERQAARQTVMYPT